MSESLCYKMENTSFHRSLEMSSGYARKKHFNNDLGGGGGHPRHDQRARWDPRSRRKETWESREEVEEEVRLGPAGGKRPRPRSSPQQRQGQGQDLMLAGCAFEGYQNMPPQNMPLSIILS